LADLVPGVLTLSPTDPSDTLLTELAVDQLHANGRRSTSGS
jgi:hypothetical protein